MSIEFIGMACALGLSAMGSAFGAGFAAQASVGAWKKCYANGKPAPFIMVAFSGAPLTQTIYGFLLMNFIRSAVASGADPALAMFTGIFAGLAIGLSAFFQGKVAAARRSARPARARRISSSSSASSKRSRSSRSSSASCCYSKRKEKFHSGTAREPVSVLYLQTPRRPQASAICTPKIRVCFAASKQIFSVCTPADRISTICQTPLVLSVFAYFL